MSNGEAPQAMPLASDLLHTTDSIAAYIYGDPPDEKTAESNRRKVYHAIEKHGLPAFKLGGNNAARKSTILKWIEAQERSA